MRIGIIGAGNIGATLARSLTKAGHKVAVANSRGPESLREIEASTGARAVTIEQVGNDVDALILSIPQRAVAILQKTLFARAPFIIDTNNYYPFRDGRIEALDNGLADSVWVAQQIDRPVVKAFNSIQSNSLAHFGRPAGAPDRIALPISGDNREMLKATASIVDDVGFDAVEAGDLQSSWRQQPGSPVYCTDLGAEDLRRMLPLAVRAKLPELRDAAINSFMGLSPPPTPEQRREIFRRLYLQR